MSRDKNLNKIRKCLALSKSSNPHEAAAALRQAKKLMSQYGVSEQDIDLLNVKKFGAKSGNANKPPKWMHMLVAVICEAFSVDAFFKNDLLIRGAEVQFIGIDEAPEIAGYAYDVLRRQLVKDRSEHVKKQSRCKPATKTRRGDLFAENWVMGVHHIVMQFAAPMSEKHKQLIETYKNANHKNLRSSKPREHKAKGNDWQSQDAGYSKGRNAKINQGVNGDSRRRISTGVTNGDC